MPQRDNDPVKRLDEYFVDILNVDTSRAYSLIPMVERTLRQYRLHPRCEANDILFEAYLRTRKAIENGREIRDERGWIKTTCVNIIREKSREFAKTLSYDPFSPVLENYSNTDEIQAQETRRQKLQLLWRAFAQFQQQDQFAAKLMRWKFLERMSWDEIQARLQREEGKLFTAAALRQQGRRAKSKIRQIYHGLEAESEGIVLR